MGTNLFLGYVFEAFRLMVLVVGGRRIPKPGNRGRVGTCGVVGPVSALPQDMDVGEEEQAPWQSWFRGPQASDEAGAIWFSGSWTLRRCREESQKG